MKRRTAEGHVGEKESLHLSGNRPRVLRDTPLADYDECFIAAAQATADQIRADLRANGMLFQSQSNILASDDSYAPGRIPVRPPIGTDRARRDVRAWIERPHPETPPYDGMSACQIAAGWQY